MKVYKHLIYPIWLNNTFWSLLILNCHIPHPSYAQLAQEIDLLIYKAESNAGEMVLLKIACLTAEMRDGAKASKNK